MTSQLPAEEMLTFLYILIPTYVTNAAPVVLGGGRPLDLGRNFFDGRRIFGENKTIRGFLGGFTVGLVIAVTYYLLIEKSLFLLAVLTSLGALTGDLLGAFAKRRFGVKSGGRVLGLDQVDFIFGALLFAAPFYRLSLTVVLLLILVTPPVHVATNLAAYRLGLKSTYW